MLFDVAASVNQPRLSPEQQNAFAHYVRNHYGRFLLLFNFATLLAYNLYAVADYWLMPDMASTSLTLRLSLSAMALCNMYWVFYRWQNIRLMDLLVPLQAIVCTLTWFELLKHSDTANIENFAFAAVIFLLVPNLGVRYSQRLMLLCSLAITSVIIVNAYILYGNNHKALAIFALGFVPIALLSMVIGWHNVSRIRHAFLCTREEHRQRGEQANLTLQLQAQALTDPLTLTGNRRAFDLELQQNWQRLQRHNQPFALLLIDIDYFKPYNDHYGHLAGDRCLRQVAHTLKTALRSSQSKLFRYGGEEFALLLSDCRQAELHSVAERLRNQVYNLQLEHLKRDDALVNITISLGAVLASTKYHSAQALFQACDEQLYKAKGLGRNQTCTSLSEH